MSSSCRIAIVGGGLAGLAAANALQTFGIEAQVFEAAPELGEIGASVNCSPQAVKALIAVGVGEQIAAIGHKSPGTYTRNMQTGEFLDFNDRIAMIRSTARPITPFTAPIWSTPLPILWTRAAFISATASQALKSSPIGPP